MNHDQAVAPNASSEAGNGRCSLPAALNAAQRSAVEHGITATVAGPLLVIAGAGLGKTNIEPLLPVDRRGPKQD